MAAAFLAAPLGAGAETRLVLEFATLPGHFQAAGARGVYDSFLGGWQGADSLEDLDAAGGFVFGGPGREISAELRTDVARDWQLRLRLSHGRARYDLPEGVGIFIDPATIDVRYTSLGAEMSHRLAAFELFGHAAEFTGGIGALATRIDTHFGSALLDVRDRTETTEGMLRLGAEWSLVPGDPAARGVPLLGADLRHYEGGMTDLRIALRARF